MSPTSLMPGARHGRSGASFAFVSALVSERLLRRVTPRMSRSRIRRAMRLRFTCRPGAAPWRNRVDVVAMDGVTGFTTATTKSCPRRSW